MFRKTLLIATGLILLLFLSPPLNLQEEEQVVFVDLNKLIQTHPRFQEVLKIEEEITLCQAELLRSKKSEPLLKTHQETISLFLKGYSNNLFLLCSDEVYHDKDFIQAIEEYEEEAYSALYKRLEDKNWELTSLAKTEINQMVFWARKEKEAVQKQIDEIYLPKIFDLQIKLELLKLPLDEIDLLKDQLLHLQQTRETLLEEKMAFIDKTMDEEILEIIDALEREMQLFTDSSEVEVEKDIAYKRKELENELALCAIEFRNSLEDEFAQRLERLMSRYQAGSQGGTPQVETRDFEREIASLSHRKERILSEIEADIKENARFLERQRGIFIYYSPAVEIPEGLDFTWKFLDTIIKKELRGGG